MTPSTKPTASNFLLSIRTLASPWRGETSSVVIRMTSAVAPNQSDRPTIPRGNIQVQGSPILYVATIVRASSILVADSMRTDLPVALAKTMANEE